MADMNLALCSSCHLTNLSSSEMEVRLNQLALIMVFGALGTLSRYSLGMFSSRFFDDSFPFGTLIINVSGCLVFGFIMQLSAATEFIPRGFRVAATVGFLGAFTTFSTFGFETYQLIRDGAMGRALVNGTANLLSGLFAVWLGVVLAGYLASFPTSR